MPDAKKTLFTVITIIVIPSLFFVLLELSLVVLGIGKSFDYFHEIDINGETYYQENPDFADQFYPPSLNIGPLENTFPKARGADVVRVYVLGGSAAQGFPYKNHGFSRLLSAQLRAAMPGKTIEVINTAMTSVNSHVVYDVARSIPAKSADFAVILMGNNEVVGPYGPGTFNQNFIGNITLIRGIQALKRTRIWQAMDAVIQKARSSDAMEELEWQGMQMFTEHGVPLDDPRMESVYSHYEDNLVSIVEMLRDKGIHVVLSTVPVNLRHSAPFLSVHDPGLSGDQLDTWAQSVRQGAMRSDQGDWDAAISHFQNALELDPGYADTHFRLATAFENAGNLDAAEAHYRRALDLDALRFRADTEINRIVRNVADRSGRDLFSFVDNAAAFEQASDPYQPGWDLLLEHVHYDFAGNHVVAREVSRSIVGKLTDDASYQPLPASEIARRVGFPNHDTIGEIQNLIGMIQHPPFPGQGNYVEFKRHLSDKLAQITAEVGTQRAVVDRRRDVVRSGLVDWKVHFELAVLNERLENSPGMYYHLNRIIDLYPHNRETYMKIAEAMAKDGRWREAIPYLEQSLYYTRGDEKKIAETINWLGTAYLRTDDYDKATDYLLELPSEYPDQVDLSLRAYGNLINYTQKTGNEEDRDRYIKDVQRYARSLIRKGKDTEYPLLYRRMSQIMALGGYDAEAEEWSEMQPQ